MMMISKRFQSRLFGLSLVTSLLLLLVGTSTFTATALAIRPGSSSTLSPRRATSPVSKRTTITPLQQTTATSATTTEPNDDGASIPTEVFNLVKSIVGAGVLSLPYGVAAFGNAPSALVPAIALIAVMGALSGYTFGLIGRLCQKTNTSSYSDAWDAIVGRAGALVAFSCFIDCFAGNLSYSMILADTFVSLLAGVGVTVTRTQSLLGVTGLVLAPLCFMKNLASLAPFSLVGIVGVLYTTLVMGLRYASNSYGPGGEFFTSQLAKPVFGSVGASGALTPKALILMCMLSK
jgi:hypothetical protein